MSYRDPDPPAVDREEIAVAALGRHAQRVRRRILLPAIFVGIALAIAAYLAAREVQFAMFHAQVPWLSAVVGGLPVFAACLRIGAKLGDAVVSRRAPTWARETARTHDLPEGTLDDFLDVL